MGGDVFVEVVHDSLSGHKNYTKSHVQRMLPSSSEANGIEGRPDGRPGSNTWPSVCDCNRADAAFLLHPQPQFAGLSELRMHPQVQEIVVRIVRGDHVGLILGIAEAMEHDLVATDDPIAQRRDRDREEDCNRSTSARSARSSPPLPRMLRPSSTQKRTAPV